MRSIPYLVTFLGVLCEISGAFADAGGVSAATQGFLEAHPQMRMMVSGERAAAIYGNSFLVANAGETPAALAQRFVTDHGDALGVDNCDLEFVRSDVIKQGQIEVFTYRQKIEGLPVHGSVVKIPVHVGQGGTPHKIGFVGCRMSPHPIDPLAGDMLTAEQAVAVVTSTQEFAHMDTFGEATKVMFEAKDASLHRVWSFWATGGAERYGFFVDTSSGKIVGAYDAVLHGSVSGTVRGAANLCYDPATTGLPTCCPDGDPECYRCCPTDDPRRAESCPQLVGMPGVEVSIPGEAAQFADSNGFYEFTGLPESEQVTVNTRLVGEWVTVEVSPPPNITTSRTATVPATDVDLTFNLTDPIACYLDPTQRPPASDTMQVNAFYSIQKTHDWFRKAFGGPFAGVDRPIPCLVADGNCAGFYTPILEGGPLIALQGAICYSKFTIFSHEYGHFIHDSIIGIFADSDGAFKEGGVGDAVATLAWDTEVLYGSNVDVPDVILNDCGTPLSFCSCSDLYCTGHALSGAFWDLRKVIGLDATSSLFVNFLFVARGQLDPGVLAEVLTADDDDGNLCNDSPNKQAIIDAFGLHGWTWDNNQSCEGGAGVKVAWFGPPQGPGPQLGTDYTVNTLLDPPHVTLRSTRDPVSGAVVTDYIVGRIVSAGGTPGDIGRITDAWNPPANADIRVQVGQPDPPDDPTLRVANVGIIDIPAQSLQNYSNILLEVEGSVTGRARCYAVADQQNVNIGKGGRISGNVAGVVQRLDAHAVGLGDSIPGLLTVGGSLGFTALHTIPNGSTVVATGGIDTLILAGDLDGAIEGTTLSSHFTGIAVAGSLSGSITLSAPSGEYGSIKVNGDIASTAAITFQGNTSGDIIANADGVGGGSILGQVTVAGTFNGNICGDNVSAGALFPPNIQIGHFGLDSTICDVVPQSGCTRLRNAPIAGPGTSNRFLSFSNPHTVPSAIRVKLTGLQHPDPPNIPQNPPPDFSAFEYALTCTDGGACVRWVGKPGTFLESQGNTGYGSFKAARLQCSPYYHDWSGEGVIHVTGAEIVPSSQYEIQVVSEACSGSLGFESIYSDALPLTTTRRGDVAAPFQEPSPASLSQPNALDVAAVINKLKNLPGALSKVIVQLQPNLPELNANVNALDIVAVVDAVRGLKYNFPGPCVCPSKVVCLVPCTGPNFAACRLCDGGSNNGRLCNDDDPNLGCPEGTCGGLGGQSLFGRCVKTCVNGINDGEPCINNTHCPGGTCGPGFFCRDSCGRCTP